MLNVCVCVSKESWHMLEFILKSPDNYDFMEMCKVETSSANTVLHVLASKGKRQYVSDLISKGLNVNQGNSDGLTPMHVATQCGHLTMIEELIKHGADPNLEDKRGRGAVFHVRDEKTLTFFHKHGYLNDVNVKDKNGDTLLHNIVGKNLKHLVIHLIKLGIDINQRNACGESPLRIAIDKNFQEIALVLMDFNACLLDGGEKSLLHLATERGSLVLVKALLKSIKANVRDDEGRTALHLGVQAKRLDLVKLLLRKGADIDAVDNDGYTSLHVACRLGKDASLMVKHLLDEGATIDLRTYNGDTALHICATSSNDDTLEVLLENGATDLMSCRNNNSQTPLLFALEYENDYFIKKFNSLGFHYQQQYEIDSVQSGGDKKRYKLLKNESNC